MVKSKNYITISLVLPDNFKNHLLCLLDDFFDDSCNKWGLDLNSDDQDIVFDNSIKQLENKVSFIFGNKWDIDTPVLTINLYTGEDSSRHNENIIITQYNSSCEDVSCVKVHDGWRIALEDDFDAISINNLYEIIIQDITTWLNTAVFYGVGSFA